MTQLPDPLIVVCPACGAPNRVPRAKLSAQGTCGRCHQALFTGQPVDLSGARFDAHAARSDLPLLVDFWAAWCGPCRQMAPAFATAAAQLEPQVRLGKLDTEAEPAIAARFAVQSIPTLVLLHKGRELGRTAGAMPPGAIVRWVQNTLAG